MVYVAAVRHCEFEMHCSAVSKAGSDLRAVDIIIEGPHNGLHGYFDGIDVEA